MHPRLEAWMARGRFVDVDGREVFVWEQGDGATVLALHGFPTSSYDWRRLANVVKNRRFVALDLPGFGLSDKSPDADYSLGAQADVVEAVARALALDRCELIAHDMGDSVAAELLARANEGRLGFQIERALLLNGSIFIERAHLTSGQKLFLRLPARRLPVPVPLRAFRRQIRSLFSPRHAPAPEEYEMMELLLAHRGGDRIVPITIRYVDERWERAPRWTAALVDFTGPLEALWGELDPVAVPAMVDRLRELRPATRIERWSDVGHWPQIEVPDRVAAALLR